MLGFTMSPDTTWSDHLNKSDIKLSSRSVDWKNLMNECLMATPIRKNDSFGDKHLNPNLVMNMRHEMAKNCRKTSPKPRCEILSEAMKIMRENNNKKLLKIKEDNLIKGEIGKIKQTLDCPETSKNYLKTDEIKKYRQPFPKATSKNINLWAVKVKKRYWVEKIDQAEAREKAEGPDETKKKEVTRTRIQHDDSEKDEVNSRSRRNSCDDIFAKLSERVETEEKEMTGEKVKLVFPSLDLMCQRRLERAWRTWRFYVQRQKRREKEKKIIVDKIEAFLRKLKQREKERQLQLIVRTNEEKPKILKFLEKGKGPIKDEEQLEKLQKLLQEVKKSQAEVFQRLRSRKKREEKKLRPKFLFRMEERREERLRRRKEIVERRQKLKEEKENSKKQAGEERLEQEKRKWMEELKEKRQAEKEKKQEQRLKREKLKRDEFVAKSHYRKFLLKNYGLKPWMMLMKLTEAQYNRAVKFDERRLLLSLFKWNVKVREEAEAKERRAEQSYKENLVRRYWSSWVRFRMERISEKQVAQDWYDLKILERTFRNWLWFMAHEQLEYLSKKEIADSYYKRKLKMKYLKKLHRYPEYEKQEREREIRRLKWRQKVKEILPDYQPTEVGRDWQEIF